jgi:RNA polymerase sigma-70 factor (ECF subfamily)
MGEMHTNGRDSSSSNVQQVQLFLKRHSADLLAYVNRHLPSQLKRHFDPKDVVQDTYFEVFRRIDEFTPQEEDSARRWILTIARHRMQNLLRIHNRPKHGGGEVKAEEDLVNGPVMQLLEDVAFHRKTPSGSASRRETLMLVESSIANLRPDYQKAVQLRYIEGCSLGETAKRIERSPDAAHALCMRALAALRVELGTASGYV